MSVCMDTTSVPRWEEERRIADRGRTFTILSFGEEATEPARKLLPLFTDRRVDWNRLPAEWSVTAARLLGRQLDASRVGWRLILVGPEAAVLAAHAEAMAGGLVDDEIMPVAVGSADRTVYCAHCHATHLAAADVGRTTSCPQCHAKLVVYHHVSRKHGAYLGYMIDAEER